MTREEAKMELMSIYGSLSSNKQIAIDTLLEQEPCKECKKLLGQIIKEISEIDDRNGWVPIDEVFDIILKYQKGGKE